MQIKPWQQRVLVATADANLRELVGQAFRQESEVVISDSGAQAMRELTRGPWNVVLVDAASLRLSPSLEVARFADELFPGVTIIMVVRREDIEDLHLAKKSGAALVMDRAEVSLNLMIFIIRVLRRRTFRTVIGRDLPVGQVLPVDLYHFLPLNRRYSVFLKAGTVLSDERREKLAQSHVRHLYVRDEDLSALVTAFRNVGGGEITESLSILRGQYRQFIIELFDCSTDGQESIGKELLRDGMSIVRGCAKLVDRYSNPREALAELPYPRWSTIAHGINSLIYALVFGEVCGISHRDETAFAAHVHNLGEATMKQTMLERERRDFSQEEEQEYRTHVSRALDLLRRKKIPTSPLLEDAILHHHENYDGSGYPDQLAGDRVSLQAGLLSLIDTYDYYSTARPGKPALSPDGAWQELKSNENWAKRFHPELIAELDKFFR